MLTVSELPFYFEERLLGALSPSRRASLNPIAIACFRLVTFLPERPDLSLPCFISCIARSTFLADFLLYFRFDFLRVLLLFLRPELPLFFVRECELVLFFRELDAVLFLLRVEPVLFLREWELELVLLFFLRAAMDLRLLRLYRSRG